MQTKNINFKKYSSFRIGSSLDVAILDNTNLNELKDYYLIGSCNNVLIGDKPPKLMMLSKEYDYIKIEANSLKIGGATPSGKIASFCKKNDITHFEFVSHLPGKLGGLVYMNAGLKEYEIFNNLINIKTTSGIKNRKNINFGYRFTDIQEPILEATFTLKHGFDKDKLQIFKNMRLNQPKTPSAGSCFKNPDGDYAGRLIEEVGLKGYRVGDMEFSKVHANFLVNLDNGTFEDSIHLIKEAQKRVYEKFDIWLECELVILDERYMSEDSPLIKPLY